LAAVVGAEIADMLPLGTVNVRDPKDNPSTSKLALEGGVARPKAVPANGGAVFRGIIQNSLFTEPGLLDMKTTVAAAFNGPVKAELSVIVLVPTLMAVTVTPVAIDPAY